MMQQNAAEVVFLGSFEVDFDQSCALYGEGKGAFVYCLVRALSEARAIELMQAALEQDHYQIKTIESIQEATNLDWEGDDPETAEMMRELTKAAQKDENVHYSEFFVYGDD